MRATFHFDGCLMTKIKSFNEVIWRQNHSIFSLYVRFCYHMLLISLECSQLFQLRKALMLTFYPYHPRLSMDPCLLMHLLAKLLICHTTQALIDVVLFVSWPFDIVVALDPPTPPTPARHPNLISSVMLFLWFEFIFSLLL